MNILFESDSIDFIHSVNYAIFIMGATKDDNLNEAEKSEHLFKLWELVKYLLHQYDKIHSVNYAIFIMGATKDDNLNEAEKSEHLFKLWELVKYLHQYDKVK